MTRTLAPALLTHHESGGTTMAWAMKVTRVDGVAYGWTSHDADGYIGGFRYDSQPGLDVASLVSTAGLQVDNTEITILADDLIITVPDILAGRWDGAAFELFRYNWAAPADGRDVRKVGNFGNVRPQRGAYVAELRGLRQRLQASIGNVTQPTCRNRLGDARCGVDLTDSPNFTSTGTLTGVNSQQVLRDSALVQPAGWFTGGVLTFLDGDNVDLSFKVKDYAADGTITLDLPLIYPAQVGDAYRMVAGCLKRLSDCRDKFSNVLNFYGEPHLPGIDSVTSPPDFSE